MLYEVITLGSKYMRPEAGMYGIFNQAIIFGDKIEDRLYFGDEDEAQSSLSNEEILMMIRHNFVITSYSIHYTKLYDKDNTLAEIKALAEKDKRVKYISLSRNFGKESAMHAGLVSSKRNNFV